MKKNICLLFITVFILGCVIAKDLMSVLEKKDYFPIQFLELLESQNRDTVLKFNPDIIKNTEYDFAYERNTDWYETGTFSYLFLTKNENKIEISLDGDYLKFSVKSRNFCQEYFLADKNTSEQIVSLITTNTVDLSKVHWPRHANGKCDYEKKK